MRFEKWHFLWIQVVLIKFISRFFCWEKTLIHLALQTTAKNLFHQKERFDLFSNNISMLDRECYRLNFVDMLFSQEIHLLLFCSFSKVSIEIEGEMLVLMLLSHFCWHLLLFTSKFYFSFIVVFPRNLVSHRDWGEMLVLIAAHFIKKERIAAGKKFFSLAFA